MKNGIESQVIEEGNLRAVKDTGDFGGTQAGTSRFKKL